MEVEADLHSGMSVADDHLWLLIRDQHEDNELAAGNQRSSMTAHLGKSCVQGRDGCMWDGKQSSLLVSMHR